jgi:hypothetical protein
MTFGFEVRTSLNTVDFLFYEGGSIYGHVDIVLFHVMAVIVAAHRHHRWHQRRLISGRISPT